MTKTPNEFYAEMLVKTDIKFKQSPVYELQKSIGKNWNYGICLTPIASETGIICGINYGGGNDDFNFVPPQKMPSGKDITNYRFIKQSKSLLKKHLEFDFKNTNFNYTNLCSFRTPSEKILTIKDYELSLSLFEEYVNFINPPWILAMGNKNIEVLQKFGTIKNIKKHYDNQNKFKGFSAKLWDWNIYSVPHPMARIKGDSREVIWIKVTEELKKNNHREQTTRNLDLMAFLPEN